MNFSKHEKKTNPPENASIGLPIIVHIMITSDFTNKVPGKGQVHRVYPRQKSLIKSHNN